MAKIGLIDVDNIGNTKKNLFPNLAIMKLSAWHKSQGDEVEWCFPLKHYDIVYQSKVFDDTYTKDIDFVPFADKIVKGGTGYDMKSVLPDEVEHMMPDYSLYGITDTAYGFLTRGCPRGCDFCIVGKKEGLQTRKAANLDEFWSGQKEIKLLDPNITAAREFEDLMSQLIASKAYVDFTQGIDIRLVTPRKMELLSQVKVKMVHFAWDNPKDNLADRFRVVAENAPSWVRSRKLRAYVLTNFNSTEEEDLYRIYTLRDIGVDPYMMVYDKPNAPKRVRQMQRWCNNKFIFRSCADFNDYGKAVA